MRSHFLDQGAFDLSPEAVAKFAIENELRLIQSKLDRMWSFIEKNYQSLQSECKDLSDSNISRLAHIGTLHEDIERLKSKLRKKSHVRGKKVRIQRAKRKSTLDKLYIKKDARNTQRNSKRLKRNKR